MQFGSKQIVNPYQLITFFFQLENYIFDFIEKRLVSPGSSPDVKQKDITVKSVLLFF